MFYNIWREKEHKLVIKTNETKANIGIIGVQPVCSQPPPTPPPPFYVGIHEHCTVAEILVFGRETGFPTQTLQRWYKYKSLQ
jgi:hypothetical protein